MVCLQNTCSNKSFSNSKLGERSTVCKVCFEAVVMLQAKKRHENRGHVHIMTLSSLNHTSFLHLFLLVFRQKNPETLQAPDSYCEADGMCRLALSLVNLKHKDCLCLVTFTRHQSSGQVGECPVFMVVPNKERTPPHVEYMSQHRCMTPPPLPPKSTNICFSLTDTPPSPRPRAA